MSPQILFIQVFVTGSTRSTEMLLSFSVISIYTFYIVGFIMKFFVQISVSFFIVLLSHPHPLLPSLPLPN